ncbi:MAG TPA: signal peptide peptidase SppA [Bacteroidales bacterium]|nr:signal peptide peptidase SppA [Bacteroidales bacterium]
MKSFFKYLLASVLGVIIATILLFFIFMGVIGAIMTSQDKPVEIKANTVLLLKLDQPINDRKSPMPVLVYNITTLGTDNHLGLNDILGNIAKAAKDENIRGIYLELSGLRAGIATLEEIRNALLDFRKSGKFIVAFSNSYTQGTYYLASAASKIFLNPGGTVDFVGLSAEVMFYKKTLEKLDIEPEIIRHGKFKSAMEPFMYDKMSPENREQIQTYMGSIWDHIVGQIAESRHVTPEKLNSVADNLLLWNDSSTVSLGIVDTLLYKDQVLDTLAQLVNINNSKNLKFVTHHKYLRTPKLRNEKGYTRDKIAVIYAAGDIVTGEQGEGSMGSERISKAVRNARQDSSIKAIVFRVNSGGGSALASEVIWRELSLARKTKPVIASLGDVAASGGYYVVAAADTIVASPNTITGSIGVFGVQVNASGFLENKLGITLDVEKTNTYSDFGSFYRPLSLTERRVWQNMVDKIYTTFVTRVSDGRKMTFGAVDSIGEGRVWSGNNALDLGLVDVIGGLNTSIDIAARKANLENYRIIELPKLEDPFTQIMKELSQDFSERIIRKELGANYKYYRYMKQIISGDRIQARIPFELSVR